MKRALRTVTPGPRLRADAEIDSVGWALCLGLVIPLVPTLPVLAVVWVVSKTTEFVQ
jgi:hypothetical protein